MTTPSAADAPDADQSGADDAAPVINLCGLSPRERQRLRLLARRYQVRPGYDAAAGGGCDVRPAGEAWGAVEHGGGIGVGEREGRAVIGAAAVGAGPVMVGSIEVEVEVGELVQLATVALNETCR
jgi:hypothetical protein